VPRFRVADGLIAILFLLTAAAAQPPLGTPESGAPSQSADPDTRNAPCQPQGAGLSKPFDTCKYLPLGPGIRPPRATSIVDPKYTDAARKAKINGSVIVAVAINEEGGVDDVKIVRSLGYGLDQNAMAAARQGKFTPATKDGKPVPVQLNMEMTFKLY
jgi:TonB family protein